MKSTAVTAALLAAAFFNHSYAGDLTFKKEKSELFTYFDSSESVAEFYIQQKTESPQVMQTVFVFNISALSTICANVFEISRVEKSFFSSKKTVIYNHQVINASKIKNIRPLTVDEKIKLGFDADEKEDAGYVELSDGSTLYALTPRDSKYSLCGMMDGRPEVSGSAATPAEYYVEPFSRCTKEDKVGFPVLGAAFRSPSFLYGNEAKSVLTFCQAKEVERKLAIEKEKENEIQARKDADAKFETEKRRHTMISGLQLLGKLGSIRSQQLIYTCLRPVSSVNFASEYTKEEWRKIKCAGYYVEEVEGLLREMRVRGLIAN